MLQGLDYEIQAVMPAAIATGLFVSLCTIQAPDGLPGYGGAPSGNYADVAGLIDIQCMDAVPSDAKIQATEVKDMVEIASKGFRHLLLDNYYPQVTPDGQIPTYWRAIVDGVSYDVLGVEHDSQNTQTRLELEIVQV
jgi:hypothetical protein